jgi:hypothetical protein
MSRDLYIYNRTPFIVLLVKSETSPVAKNWLIWSNVSSVTELGKKVTAVTQNDAAVAAELREER